MLGIKLGVALSEQDRMEALRLSGGSVSPGALHFAFLQQLSALSFFHGAPGTA